jgi:hypothetical protein
MSTEVHRMTLWIVPGRHWYVQAYVQVPARRSGCRAGAVSTIRTYGHLAVGSIDVAPGHDRRGLAFGLDVGKPQARQPRHHSSAGSAALFGRSGSTRSRTMAKTLLRSPRVVRAGLPASSTCSACVPRPSAGGGLAAGRRARRWLEGRLIGEAVAHGRFADVGESHPAQRAARVHPGGVAIRLRVA